MFERDFEPFNVEEATKLMEQINAAREQLAVATKAEMEASNYRVAATNKLRALQKEFAAVTGKSTSKWEDSIKDGLVREVRT